MHFLESDTRSFFLYIYGTTDTFYIGTQRGEEMGNMQGSLEDLLQLSYEIFFLYKGKWANEIYLVSFW